MHTHVQKWGNSIGLRIPKGLAQQLSLQDGSAIQIEVKGNHLVITPLGSSLALLLDQITDDNLPDGSWEGGNPAGCEEW